MLARGNRMTFRKWEMTFFVLLKTLKNSSARFFQISVPFLKKIWFPKP